jgi:DNA-binding GntR family transcriptional regulator
MSEAVELLERRTATDVVFDTLHDEIVSLTLLPGTKLSETDVSRRFGVSRQPVRDAFNRLANLDLMLIRPQKASEVRGFSMERIAHARFVRLAIELEVIWNACAVWDDPRAKILERSLEEQEQAIAADQFDTFHMLDQKFHQLICDLGGCPLAAKSIQECKRKVDRLCMLGLGRGKEAATLLKDHRKLARALKKKSIDTSTMIVRQHLGRLDNTIAEIRRDHSEYFE